MKGNILMNKKSKNVRKASKASSIQNQPNTISPSVSSHRDLTDLGNAERFVEQHGSIVKYCPEQKQWFVYDQGYWKPDSGELIDRLAFQTVHSIKKEANDPNLSSKEKEEILSHARKSASRGHIKGMLELAKAFPEITIHSNKLDTDPWLLNCQNGTLNLKTGELQPHKAEDLITKMVQAPYDPNAKCPLWDGFISRIMGNDQKKMQFLQSIFGYTLTGDTSEQCMFIFYGPGANGKTTLIEVQSEFLAGYARHTTTASLLNSTSSPIRNDLARLHSTRLVSAVELGMGKRLDEALVKQLTGGDLVTARFLYKEYFEFQPQFKLIIAANHKPDIRGVDHGIWRRIVLIPFDVTIPSDEIDKDLPSKLRNELPGILAWAVRGCLEWLSRGLAIPESIAAATSEYRHEMDILANFQEDRCTIGPSQKVPLGDLFEAFREWCGQACQDVLGKKMFGNLMRQKGFSQSKNDGVGFWKGLSLKAGVATPAAEDKITD
jgi:putative DNA primase/helicase